MKILTILLLMISTQAQAVTSFELVTADVYTIEQCNQIANVSKRTIKAAISGVPIAVVINKLRAELDGVGKQFKDDTDLENITIADSPHHQGLTANQPQDKVRLMEFNDWAVPGCHSTSIYKTVDQIKTKYGQVRPQDRVRLARRVEQKLIECRQMAFVEDTKNLDDDFND